MKERKVYFDGDIVEGRFWKWKVLDVTKAKDGSRLLILKCQKCGKEIEKKEKSLFTSGVPGCIDCWNKRGEDLYKQGLKQCKRCNRILPLTAFRERKKCTWGLNHTCKECEVKGCKDPEYLANWEENTKRCKRCKQIKTPADFWKYPASADGLMYWCKACDTENKRLRHLREKAAKLTKQELLEKRYQKELQIQKLKEEKREEKQKLREAFQIAKKKFYEDPENKGYRFTFLAWKRGDYDL